jgi:hypothetical protein
MGSGGFFPRGVKRQGREADHSPQSIAKIKMVELYIYSPIRLHSVVLDLLSPGTTLGIRKVVSPVVNFKVTVRPFRIKALLRTDIRR